MTLRIKEKFMDQIKQNKISKITLHIGTKVMDYLYHFPYPICKSSLASYVPGRIQWPQNSPRVKGWCDLWVQGSIYLWCRGMFRPKLNLVIRESARPKSDHWRSLQSKPKSLPLLLFFVLLLLIKWPENLTVGPRLVYAGMK